MGNGDLMRLVPEEYRNYKIYVYKKKTRFGKGYWIQVLDEEKRVILKRQVNINFINKMNPTKSDIIKETKKFIDDYIDTFPNYQKEVNVGDIFVTSWGYDQTNYDYIVVVGVSPTGKTVKCQRAKHINLGSTGQSNIQKPIPEGFGDVFQMKVKRDNKSRIELVGSYPFSGNGRGAKRKGYFNKWDGEEEFYETDPIFGH
jgi:hypothetical protein